MPAPHRNLNALKHGLYSKFFDPESIKQLRKISPSDLQQEILAYRQVIKKILDNFDASDDKLTAQTNALASAGMSLVSFIRTHALLTGNYTPLLSALEEALDNVTPYTTTTQQPMSGPDTPARTIE